ncbi:MAG TPA: GTP-binding protein, partial [Acholeplasmataceae bacterium]|nr:GTP-binding protein [Acholeplasmataceae bacterium]
MEIRNVAIIAHVDHGKTTLVDKLLQQSSTYRESQHMQERAMDNIDIERERGITILAKATSIDYGPYRINIMDTPGHADFGGEVERIMKLVDGVLLLVDAKDGVMPQTKFVLRKALEENLKPIVVINKIDRPFADPKSVVNQVFDLFIDLGASDEQLEFPIIYASGLLGLSSFDVDIESAKNMKPLLDTIVNHVPAPNVKLDGPLLFQPALIDYNEYVGRMGIGKVFQGSLKVNSYVSCLRPNGKVDNFRIQKLYRYV